MMRLIFYVIILIVSVWVGLHLSSHPGSVFFIYKDWSMQIPLWFFLLAALVIFMVLYGILRGASFLSSLNYRYHTWSIRKRKRWARNKTSIGLIELTEGNWQQAEQLLVHSAKYSESPLINYLAAAKSAQEQGAYNRRDDYLRQAHASTPGAEIAVGLTQAQLQLGHQQTEQALATLRHLQHLVPHHPYVLKLLATLYGSVGDWQSLTEILPDLRKRKVITSLENANLEERIYQELLNSAAKSVNSDALHQTWKKIPKTLQKQSRLIEIYARHLIAAGDFDTAELLLRDAIKRQSDNNMIELYGLTKSSHLDKQIDTAEQWLKYQPNNPVLLLALGRLSLANQAWDKARHYLEMSAELDPKPAVYRELGILFEAIHEPTAALNAYRNGLIKESQPIILHRQ